MREITFGAVAATLLGLAACGPTQTTLDAMPYQRQFGLAENYQAVYARTFEKLRQCLGGGAGIISIPPISLEVDGQLYSDLGYGTMQVGANMPLGYEPAFQVRVDREGTGSIVSVKSAAPGDQFPAWAEYYARGGQVCQRGSGLATPPAL